MCDLEKQERWMNNYLFWMSLWYRKTELRLEDSGATGDDESNNGCQLRDVNKGYHKEMH